MVGNMTDCSDFSIKSIPPKERKHRLAAVYRLVLSLTDPNEEGDRQGLDIMDSTRFEDEWDRNLLVRNITHVNKNAG